MYVSRSAVRGGMGGYSTIGPGFVGGAGVRALNSEVLLFGGPGALIEGGDGGDGKYNTFPLGAAAVIVDPGSKLTTAADVALISGTGPAAFLGPLPVINDGTWTPSGEALVTLSAAPILAPPGSTVQLTLHGEPSTTVVVYFSFGQMAPFSISGIFGANTADLGAFVLLPVQLLDPQGATQLAVAVPSVPSLVGTSVILHGFGMSPTGTQSVSPPSLLGIR